MRNASFNFNFCKMPRIEKQQMRFKKTCALMRLKKYGPNILKKIAGTTQNIKPMGKPKSLYGTSPRYKRQAPSHDKKIFTRYGKLRNNGKKQKIRIRGTSAFFSNECLNELDFIITGKAFSFKIWVSFNLEIATNSE